MKKRKDWFDISCVFGMFICIGILCFILVSAILMTVFSPRVNFDTTALDSWCGEPVGNIRVIGAVADEGYSVLDDDNYNWSVDFLPNEDDFYLLWIDDMGTSDNKSDDELIKVWSEAHS